MLVQVLVLACWVLWLALGLGALRLRMELGLGLELPLQRALFWLEI